MAMRNKYDILYISILVLATLFFTSCYSQTTITDKHINYISTSNISFAPLFFALERDYNDNYKNYTNDEIVNDIYASLISSFKDFGFDISGKAKNEKINILFKFTKDQLVKLCDSITSDSTNPIIFYDDNNKLAININVNNYMDIAKILPLLEDETFYSYTATFNKDISEEDYLELISYVFSEDVSTALKEYVIKITISDENTQKDITFTLLDFLLLHSPIKA